MSKKDKIVEQKVYKANTKALKRILVMTIIMLAVVTLAIPVANGIRYLYLKSWEKYEVDKYHFMYQLPRAYQEVTEEKNNLNQISSIISSESSVTIHEEYAVQKPEVIYSGGSILSGVSIMIQCLSTSKTTRTLDDIADSQHVLVRIYYEDDYQISTPTKEFLTVLETDAVKTSTNLSNKNGTKTLIHYLVPLEDEEVTITFLGKKENMDNAKEEIDKIVGSMKLVRKNENA